MLQFESVDLHYGSFRALDGINLHAARRRTGRAARRQRRGQELDLSWPTSGLQQRRAAAASASAIANCVGQQPAQIVARGAGALPRGPQAVPGDVGAEEPHARRLCASRATRPASSARSTRCSRCFRSSTKKQDDPAGLAVGRPAADGGHRPRDDGPAQGAAARRAVARPRAAGGQAGVRGHPAHQPGRHHRAAGRAERVLRR